MGEVINNSMDCSDLSIRPIRRSTACLKSEGHKFRPSCAHPIAVFLPSLRICGNVEIVSRGALHQIPTGRVRDNKVDQSPVGVPVQLLRTMLFSYRSVSSFCIWPAVVFDRFVGFDCPHLHDGSFLSRPAKKQSTCSWSVPLHLHRNV